jgi:hypothetical protein
VAGRVDVGGSGKDERGQDPSPSGQRPSRKVPAAVDDELGTVLVVGGS